jgi:hypothetical protein
MSYPSDSKSLILGWDIHNDLEVTQKNLVV